MCVCVCVCVCVQHGQEKKALKALRMVHKLNHWHRGDCQFRIKHFHGLVREDSVEEVANRKTLSQRLAALSAHTKQVSYLYIHVGGMDIIYIYSFICVWHRYTPCTLHGSIDRNFLTVVYIVGFA